MRWQLLANALLFQLGWAACILAAQQSWWLLGGLACLAAQLWLSHERLAELRLVLIVTLLGSLLDSLLLNLGLFDFASNSWLLPAWLALLWALLATTLRHSLAWTARPWWLASLLGATSGPLSYYAGAQLAGVGLPLGTAPSLLLLGLLWAVWLPALHALARRLSASPAVTSSPAPAKFD